MVDPARMSVQKKASTSSAASLPLSVASPLSSGSVDAERAPSSSDAYTSRSANSNLRRSQVCKNVTDAHTFQANEATSALNATVLLTLAMPDLLAFPGWHHANARATSSLPRM